MILTNGTGSCSLVQLGICLLICWWLARSRRPTTIYPRLQNDLKGQRAFFGRLKPPRILSAFVRTIYSVTGWYEALFWFCFVSAYVRRCQPLARWRLQSHLLPSSLPRPPPPFSTSQSPVCLSTAQQSLFWCLTAIPPVCNGGAMCKTRTDQKWKWAGPQGTMSPVAPSHSLQC